MENRINQYLNDSMAGGYPYSGHGEVVRKPPLKNMSDQPQPTLNEHGLAGINRPKIVFSRERM